MSDERQAGRSEGYSILVVDDSPVMRTFIRRVLELTGLPAKQVLEADDGQSALDTLGTTKIDLILSDVNMPGMNGPEFLRRLSMEPALSAIPVLVVSTDSSRQRVDSMIKLGARGYIQKPFHPELLRDELRRVLEIEA